MARIRTIPTIHQGDGGAFGPNTRPAPHRIPDAFKAKFAEYDRIQERLNAAIQEHGTLEQSFGSLELEARKADSRSALDAARSGADVSAATPNLDALIARRAKAGALVTALRDAHTAVINELADIRTKEQANLKRYRDAENKARTELAKALEPLEPAITNLIETIAVREWLESHYPWDASSAVDVQSIWEPAARMDRDYTNNERALRITNVIEALRNI